MLQTTIAPISNQATWTDTLEFFNDEDGEPWFLESDPPDEITLKVRDAETCATVLEGSLTGGEIVVIGDGLIEFTFSATSVGALCAKTYDLGGLYTDDDEITQFYLGRLPVLKGL